MKMGRYGVRLASVFLAMVLLGGQSVALAAPDKGSPADLTEVYSAASVSAEQLRQAAEQGNAEAQFGLGYYYMTGQGVAQDYKQAVEWYRKSAGQGYAAAQNNLGICYMEGLGVPQDYTLAVEWFRKAAVQGYDEAQFNLGACYYNGHGVEQNLMQAVEWWRKAAEQGYALAQYNLGACYSRGLGVTQDYKQAVEWYRKSAEQDNAYGQYNLGNCYANGWGVTQDYKQAVEWYRKAAEQGHAQAKEALAALTSTTGFIDVPAGIWYESSVSWAVEKEIVNGTSANTFTPNRDCTHGEILTLLWRAAGKPESKAEAPITLKDSDWYAGAVRWAAEKGMIGSGFDLNKPCTRAEAVNYIWQAFNKPNAAASHFTDVPAQADYAGAVSWAVEKGVVKGTSATTFTPDKVCSRAEIVTLLYRAYQ